MAPKQGYHGQQQQSKQEATAALSSSKASQPGAVAKDAVPTVKQPPKDKTKVIVRKLPPGLSEEGFRKAASAWIIDKFDWLSYYPGKVRCGSTLLHSAFHAI